MGLFEDLWDWIKGLVQALIDWALYGVRQWVLNVVDVLIAPIKSAIEGLEKYIENVRNALKEYVDSVSDALKEYVDNVSSSLTTYIDNVSIALRENITTAISDVAGWVDSQLAGLRSYIDGRLVLWDPVGFLRDPLGYIGTAFNNLIQVWVYGVAEGLAAGIQAGLKGSNPGPVGPGASFLEGALEAVAEQEERVRDG